MTHPYPFGTVVVVSTRAPTLKGLIQYKTTAEFSWKTIKSADALSELTVHENTLIIFDSPSFPEKNALLYIAFLKHSFPECQVIVIAHEEQRQHIVQMSVTFQDQATISARDRTGLGELFKTLKSDP